MQRECKTVHSSSSRTDKIDRPTLDCLKLPFLLPSALATPLSRNTSLGTTAPGLAFAIAQSVIVCQYAIWDLAVKVNSSNGRGRTIAKLVIEGKSLPHVSSLILTLLARG